MQRLKGIDAEWEIEGSELPNGRIIGIEVRRGRRQNVDGAGKKGKRRGRRMIEGDERG